MNERFAQKNLAKKIKILFLVCFMYGIFILKMSKSLIPSFLVSDVSESSGRSLNENEQFTHSLIFSERPERFAHNRSFPLSDVSESLMVSHFW